MVIEFDSWQTEVISRPHALAGEMSTGAKMSLYKHAESRRGQGRVRQGEARQNKYKKEEAVVRNCSR